MSPLLQTLLPFKGESLKSFLMRLSMENGYESILWIYQLSNLTRRSTYYLSPKNSDLFELGALVGLESGVLWDLTFVNEFDDYLSNDYYTKLIYNCGISSIHSKICPVCIGENSYEQKLWDLNINIACYKHNVLLINECCNCHNLISSNRYSIEYCNCGYPLREFPTIQAPKNLIEISKLLHYSSTKKFTSSNNNNPLHNLSLKHIVSLLTFFSRQMAIYFDYGEFGNKIPTLDNKYQQLLIDTYNVFIDWPNNYYSLLNKIQNLRRDQKGAILQLSGIYKGIHRKFALPIFSFLRDEYYNYMREDKEREYKIVRSKTSLNEESTYLNFVEVTKKLKMKPNTIKKLVENGILDGTYKRFSGQEQVLIRKESIENYYKFIEANLRLMDVASYLGINTSRVIELEKQGLIKALLGPENGFKRWLFSKGSVQALLTNLNQLVCNEVNGEVNNEERISFNQTLKIASGYGLKIGDFINLLTNNEICPYEKDIQNTGLNQLIFNKTAVVNSLKKWNLLNASELNALEISQVIGENYDYVLMWLNAGLIKSGVKKLGKSCVYRDDLLTFQKTYISLIKLSVKLNIHSTKLRRQLLEQNIKPVFGSELDGGYLYLISDVLDYTKF
ncbi:TniQ family protein [Schinkia sp. CFF1]